MIHRWIWVQFAPPVYIFFTAASEISVFQVCEVCSSREGGDKIIWERFITGNPGDDTEANIAQVWCRRCTEVVLIFLQLSLFVLHCFLCHHTTASLSLPHLSFHHSHSRSLHDKRTKKASIPIVGTAEKIRFINTSSGRISFSLHIKAAIQTVR